MKRYAVFVWDRGDALGGLNDFYKAFRTLREAKAFFKDLQDKNMFDVIQIVDVWRWKVVFCDGDVWRPSSG